MTLFEWATRSKVRFLHKGILNVELMWDLSLEELDHLYKSYNEELKRQSEESLLKKSIENEKTKMQVDIIKHIFHVKQSEMEKAEEELLKKNKKQRLLKILAEKQDEEFKGKSVDELKELINEM